MRNTFLSTLCILTLNNISGIGKQTILNVIKKANFQPTNINELHELLTILNNLGLKIKVPTILQLKESHERAQRDLDDAQQRGIQIIGIMIVNILINCEVLRSHH